MLNVLDLPATMALLQLFFGFPIILPIWLVKAPKISFQELVVISKIATMHALGNLASVYSFGAGSVSFTHVVKAAEPIFSAIFSAIFLQNIFPLPVYLSLAPIVVGVGLASLKEIHFSWLSFSTAMLSNAFYQLRIVLAKKELTSANNTLTPASLFRIITILSAFELLPLSLLLEGNVIQSTWNSAVLAGFNQYELIRNIIISGVSYYLYNEVSFWILGLIHPITHAVGNTLKRVVLIVASVLMFNTPLNIQGSIGSGIAIFGTLLYSYVQFKSSGGKKVFWLYRLLMYPNV